MIATARPRVGEFDSQLGGPGPGEIIERERYIADEGKDHTVDIDEPVEQHLKRMALAPPHASHKTRDGVSWTLLSSLADPQFPLQCLQLG